MQSIISAQAARLTGLQLLVMAAVVAIGIRPQKQRPPNSDSTDAEGGGIYRLALALPVVALVALAFVQPVSAALTSVVSDPSGDAFFDGTPLPAPGYQDIVQATVTSEDSSFTFVIDVASPIPSNPALPPGIKLLTWQFPLNTNPATAPKGYPFAPGNAAPSEYLVIVAWDGTAFRASLVDRTPLLTGGQATVTDLSFSFNAERTEVTLSTGATMIGSPSTFQWRAITHQWAASPGTGAFFHVDTAPAPGLWASWPED